MGGLAAESIRDRSSDPTLGKLNNNQLKLLISILAYNLPAHNARKEPAQNNPKQERALKSVIAAIPDALKYVKRSALEYELKQKVSRRLTELSDHLNHVLWQPHENRLSKGLTEISYQLPITKWAELEPDDRRNTTAAYADLATRIMQAHLPTGSSNVQKLSQRQMKTVISTLTYDLKDALDARTQKEFVQPTKKQERPNLHPEFTDGRNRNKTGTNENESNPVKR